MSVGLSGESIGLDTQLNFCHILQTKDVSFHIRADYDILKLLNRLETSGVFHRILISLVGILSQSTGCSLNILSSQHAGDIRRYQIVLHHRRRIHPYSDGILASEHLELTDSIDQHYLRLNIDRSIVGQESIIICIIRRIYRKYLKHRILPLLHEYSVLLHLGREKGKSLLDSILDIDRGHIRIRPLLENDIDRSFTGIGGVGTHIEHILNTVDCLFQRRNDRLHNSLGIRAEESCRNTNSRRGYVRILLNRQ